MQFFRPPSAPPSSPSSPSSRSSAPASSQPSGFGEARAQNLAQRLEKSIAERRQLARAQQVAQSTLKPMLEQKGEMLGRRIGNLQVQQRAEQTE